MKRNCVEFEILIGLIAVIPFVKPQVVLVVLDFGVVGFVADSRLQCH
jgi:hypothetical protein